MPICSGRTPARRLRLHLPRRQRFRDPAALSTARDKTPLLLALLAVTLFSGTPTGTRIASLALGGDMTGCARALLGGVVAAIMLTIIRPPWPTSGQWRVLLLVTLSVGLGFPLVIARAIAGTGAGHAAVALGLIPLATTALGAWWNGERVRPRTLLATAVGTIAVVAEAWFASGGQLTASDGYLALAVVLSAIGYVAGARLSATMPGWQVICWANAAGLPVAVLWAGTIARHHPGVLDRLATAPLAAWLGVAWIGIISQVMGFIPWYAALSRGGISRASQIQLLQPGLSVLAAWACIGEIPRLGTVAAMLVVVFALALNRRAPATPSSAVDLALTVTCPQISR